jgi:hypothetical protein
MRDLAEYWFEADAVPETLAETLHHENMLVAYYGDAVLPHAGTRMYSQHLRFVRMMVRIPSEGAYFTKSKEHLGNAYRYVRSAILAGYLTYDKCPDTNKTRVYPTELLASLIAVSKPSDAEVINA